MQPSSRRALTALVATLALPAIVLGEAFLAGAAGAASVPGATHSVVAAPLNGAASVSWKAPTTSGGSPVVGYVVTPYLGTAKQAALVFNSTATTQTVPSLKNASAYQFTVAATNAVGTGAASTKSATVTVGTPGQPRRPMATWATNITGQLRVYFEATAKNGAPVTTYKAVCTSPNGGASRFVIGHPVWNGTAYTIVVGKLTSLKLYACRVSGINSRGTGPASLPGPNRRPA
jgi:Fibronectin type III domain